MEYAVYQLYKTYNIGSPADQLQFPAQVAYFHEGK